jgi:hypothetical protein
VRLVSPRLIANVALLTFVTAPFAGAQVSSSSLNQWTLAAAMNAPRAQACSAILPDGSMLVTGGVGSSGPVNTAEIYGTGGAFTVTSPMSQARAGAACATLLDGTVLVMGGDDGTGALSTAEIFNPVTQTWKTTGSLNAAREGHQAVVNGWGAVWVAGGTNASGIVAALEEFDPPTSTFRTVGALTTPRTEFALALLPGLKVMIAGGTNGSATLGSVEIYNGVLGTVSVAGSMAQARQDFAAAALPDGTVLIAGGRDVKGNLLSSTEIFDPVQGVSTAGPNLLTPRAYHAAYGLANNGQVLIAGGTGASGVLASTETYAPWTGAIQPSAPLNISRRDNVSAVLRPGSLLVAGGRNESGSLNSSELFQYVAIGTDKPDYAPGTPVNISGSGWQPGEQVSVQIMTVPVDRHHIEFTGSGIADGAGNVAVTGFAVDQSHLGMKFILTATGSQLQAQTTFTDGSGIPAIAFSFSPPSGTLTAGGVPVTVTVTLTGPSGTPTGSFSPCINGNCNIPGSTSPVGGSCSAAGQLYTLPSSGPATCQFTINQIPSGNTIVAIAYSGDVNYAAEVPPSDGATYAVLSPTSITMTSGPTPSAPYGTTTPYIATLTAAVGNSPSGQVQFLVNGVAYGAPVSLTPVPATNPPTFTASFVPNPPLAVNATPYLITAHFLGDTADTASTSANSISTLITAANTITTLSFSANPIVYGQPLIVSGAVTSGGGIPSGTVTVNGITGTAGCSGVTLTATGTYSCTITPPGPGVAGSPYNPVNAVYVPAAGTGYVTSTSATGTLTVNAAATQTSAPNVTAVSGGTTFTFHSQATTVAPSAAPVSTGNISFYSLPGFNNAAACATGTPLTLNVAVDATGNASSGPVTLVVNPYTICAVYTPGANFTGSTSPGQNITSPTAPVADTVTAPTGGPGTFDAPVTITATVTATTGALPPTPGTLTFIDTSNGNAVIGTAPVSQVAATTTATASVTVSNLAVGAHNVTATYSSGNGAFAAPTVSAAGTITINKSAAPFTVSSGPPNQVSAGGNAVVGSSVTLIATYTGGLAPVPTGSVNFINAADGNAIVCAGAALSAGVATCTVVTGVGNNLPPGAESIGITYVGDTNYTLGAVTPFVFTVAKAGTTTLLIPFPNPATVGNTVTLTAGVTVATPSIVPTGTITFTLGGNTPPTTTCIGAIGLTTNPGPPVTYTAVCTFELAGPGGLPPTGVPITYTAAYSGDVNTLPSTGSNSLTSIRAATTTTLVATPNPATVGQTVTLTATVASTVVGVKPTGTYSFTLGGTAPPTSTCGVPAAINPATGVATCTFEQAGPGGSSITYTAIYSGDANFLTSTGSTSMTPLPAATITTLVATPNPAAVGQTVTLTATVTSPSAVGLVPTGTYSFTLGGTVPVPPSSTCGSPIALVAGVATCTFEQAGPGGTLITYSATYSGDVSFLTSTGTTTMTPAPAATTTTLVATPNPATVGQTVTLTATVASTVIGVKPTGTYSFTLGGTVPVPPASTCGSPVAIIPATGVATCTFEEAGPGGTLITYSATYSGDANFVTSTGSTSITPLAAATTTTLAATPSPATVGQTVTLTATVASTVIGVKPTGMYSFTLGGNTPPSSTCGTPQTINSATGVATCTFELAGPAVSITYTATYSGDSNFLTSTNTTSLTPIKASTLTVLTATPNPAQLGNIVTLTATVSPSPTTPGTPVAQATAFTGSFTFLLNGTVASSTVANSPVTSCASAVPVSAAGVATCSFEIFSAANTNYTFTATYSNDTSFLGSTFSTTLATLKAPTGAVGFTLATTAPVAGQALTLIVTVPPTGSPTPLPASTGTVTITGSGVNVTAAVVNGVATVTTGTGAGSLPVLFAGSYNLTATYNGDSNYLAGETASLSFSIGKANAALSIGNANNTTTVTVTAVAPGTGTPTGVVMIYSGTTATGTPVASGSLVNGMFSVALTTGTYTATYGGDNNFNAIGPGGAVTSPITHQPATSATTVTSSINPASANQPVVLIASVSGSGATGPPTGTVTFTDNGIVIGTSILVAGVATFTTTLTSGSNNIVATYNGDSVFSGSSGSFGLTVNKPPATLLLSSSLSVSVYGQSVTLTVRVTGSTQAGAALPTGTVTFFDNNASIGVANVVNGVAALTLTNLPVGVNNITVSYSGDANFGQVQLGNAGSVTVNKAQILTTVTANTNSGQETLTATVAVVAPGGGTPTGTVQFIDTVTGQVVGTATLAGGTASITIAVTTDPIMAVYSGDGNFSTSTAANVSAIAVVNSASYAIDFAPDEIVTVFGSGLTAQTVTATLPLQTTLGGVSVTVTDSAGTVRPAVLFYVSATQIAFMIPDGSAKGTATVTVTTSGGASTATITVTNSAPGLFTANDSGAGPLAAQIVSVAPGGAQTYTNTAALNGQSFANAPISLTPAGNTFFLLLYGTGIRFGSVIAVSINGTTYTPAYAGAQGTYAGLDQINILLPASLAGSGTVSVTVTVDGQVSNAGTIAFQ